MLFSRSFYLNFLFDTRNQMIGGSGSIEEFIAQKLDRLPKWVSIIKRFGVECPPKGVSQLTIIGTIILLSIDVKTRCDHYPGPSFQIYGFEIF